MIIHANDNDDDDKHMRPKHDGKWGVTRKWSWYYEKSDNLIIWLYVILLIMIMILMRMTMMMMTNMGGQSTMVNEAWPDTGRPYSESRKQHILWGLSFLSYYEDYHYYHIMRIISIIINEYYHYYHILRIIISIMFKWGLSLLSFLNVTV